MKRIITIALVTSSVLFFTACGESANITADAFLSTQDASVKTCAGNTVYLEKYDVNGYLYLSSALNVKTDQLDSNNKNLSIVNNSLKKGLEKNGDVHVKIYRYTENSIRLEREIQEYKEKISKTKRDTIKETTCNSQGNFSFSNLEPGEYLIITNIQLVEEDKKQGGILYKKIKLDSGENKTVITQQFKELFPAYPDHIFK